MHLDLDEFIGVLCPSAETVISRIAQKFNNINEVKKAFVSIDINKDGNISRQELLESGKFNASEVDALFILGDVNGELHRIEVLFETTCYKLNKLVKRCGACIFPNLGR